MTDSTSTDERTCKTCGVSIEDTYKLRRYCDEHTPKANTKGMTPCPKCGKRSWAKNTECRNCSSIKADGPHLCNKPGRRGTCRNCYRLEKPAETCIECDRPVQARKRCTTHYSKWHRENFQKPKTCNWCGESFKTARKDTNFCSRTCAGSYASSLAHASPAWDAYVDARAAKAAPKTPARSPDELEDLWRSQRSPFRAAFEDKDYPAFIVELRGRVHIDGRGCWVWAGGKKKPSKSKTAYPTVKWRGRTYQVHRLALEAKMGAPLGSQHSHHACANTLCVNPDHLEAATHVENIAEMKARTSYESRIIELEKALRDIDPQHPILERAHYGATKG